MTTGSASSHGLASQPSGPSDLPRHIGIIMDGNGRWATGHGMPRAIGHERGVEALRRTVKAAQKLGLEFLTVYSFSTENWRRPVSEVSALFALLKTFVKQDLERLKREGVRISVFGTREGLLVLRDGWHWMLPTARCRQTTLTKRPSGARSIHTRFPIRM